jgi:RNA polymerase sigma factor (TIGR02999 family)
MVVVTPDVAPLLKRLRAGDESAFNELVSALYDELRRIAGRHLRGERPEHTLQTTALVHEAYVKLVNEPQREFADRAHFLAVASRVMRQVLVDYARARRAKKRSGNAEAKADIEVEACSSTDRIELLDLDGALDALSREDKSLARLIEMRYFGGMTAEEIAEVLRKSVHIVRHDLRLGQAWLRRRLSV